MKNSNIILIIGAVIACIDQVRLSINLASCFNQPSTFMSPYLKITLFVGRLELLALHQAQHLCLTRTSEVER